MLYQLSHFRSCRRAGAVGAESQIRTGDTAIFSRVLYQLSYLGPMANQARSPVGGGEDTTGLRPPSNPEGRVGRRQPRSLSARRRRSSAPFFPQFSGLIGRPTAESSMSVRSRRSRVSGFRAETTQWRACFRNDGGFAANHAHAASSARKRAS